jgi:heavy metal sensor kinase
LSGRSIRFRLVAWYAAVSLVVCAAFGAYTYVSLERYLSTALQDSLRRRAHQIGSSLLLSAERTGEAFVVDQLKSLYGPELNDRFIRISRPDGSLMYVSGTPNDVSFEPSRIPRVQLGPGQTTVTAVTSEHLLLLSAAYDVRGRAYLVEVGASTLEKEHALRGLLLTLGLDLPMILVLAVAGGSLLVRQALAPVQRVTDAAREITSHNLSRRLPETGTRDEIERLTAALNQMIERLEKAFQHASRFTADASHELRTPLTVMRGELESLLQDHALGSTARSRLGSLLEETERLGKIVESLLAIGRLEAGEAVLDRSRFDLSDLVVTTSDQMSLLAVDRNIEVGCSADRCVEVEGDRARLKQVIVNILDNAIKFSREGGHIQLSTRCEDGRAVFEVADSGPGIPEAALPRVFDRFFQVNGARSGKEGGAGLGLSIARLICVAHGGSVAIENDPGVGCRVQVTLPLALDRTSNDRSDEARRRTPGPGSV